MGLFYPDKRTGIEAKVKAENLAWPDNYFAEKDPEVRNELLKEKEEAGEDVSQLRKLFDTRYTKNEKGRFIDNFLRFYLELRLTGENLDKLFSKKRNIRNANAALKGLCLDKDSEFEDEILYREMCQLTSFYIETCSTDINYTAVVFGLGKTNDDRIKKKIINDLDRIGVLIPEYLNMEDEFYILKQAVVNTKEMYFE